jgi:hypothetical protein
MKKPILALLLSILLLIAVCVEPRAQDAGVPTDTDRIERAIAWLMRLAPVNPLTRSQEKRQELAEEIVQTHIEFDIDAFLLTAIFFSESSFKTDAAGKAGEKGFGQIGRHGRRMCKKAGINYKQRLDQMRCAGFILRSHINKCGSIYDGLIAYVGYGTCKLKNAKKHRQVRYKLKLAEKLRRVE